jgi:hypothetical protein
MAGLRHNILRDLIEKGFVVSQERCKTTLYSTTPRAKRTLLQLKGFSQKLIKILNKKNKSKLKKDHVVVVDKLRKEERLSSDEFWSVYNSIRKEGPEVRFKNSNKWIDSGE